MKLVKVPWIRPAVVVHDPAAGIDELLADFALALSARGFRVAGFVQLNNRNGLNEPGEGCADRVELLDLDSGETIALERRLGAATPSLAMAAASLRAAHARPCRPDGNQPVCRLRERGEPPVAAVEDGIAHGLPVLTSISGRAALEKWYRFAGHGGAMLAPDMAALWQWWGAERLYRDLALGVADEPVKRIVCGPRWLMIEGPAGVGLAPLPKGPAPLLPRLPALQQMTLRALADLTGSWDALEMAVGVAAINAHYNRSDLEVAFGNGAHAFREADGRVMVIGAFPGLSEILPGAQVIEAQPRPGELPTIAMDTVLPGCAAAVVSASSVVNRTLPRILRLTAGSRVALIGPATPMTPRLHAYGIEILGGLRVRNADGLAEAVAAGGLPRDFDRFGDFVHIRSAEQHHPHGRWAAQPRPASVTASGGRCGRAGSAAAAGEGGMLIWEDRRGRRGDDAFDPSAPSLAPVAVPRMEPVGRAAAHAHHVRRNR